MYRVTHVVGISCLFLAGRAGVTAEEYQEKYGARGQNIMIGANKGFILEPAKPGKEGTRPWVWYAPTVGDYPNLSNQWVMRKLLDRGVYVCGMDVGESKGNAAGRKLYSEFYQVVVPKYKLDPKASLIGQSRGGLMMYNWAAENPEKVRCVLGIYPICGGNGVEKLEPLVKAGVPILHIHGDADKSVPLEKHSKPMLARYTALGGKMQLIVVPGKGHAEIPEYFEEPRLVEFLSAGGFAEDKQTSK